MTEFIPIGKWLRADFDTLESTNDEAARLSNAESAFQQNIIVTAHRQLKGRGRRGRNWIGLKGNLFMSLLMPMADIAIGAFSLISAIALLKTIKQLSPKSQVLLKWPNDVLLYGGKVSGILVESGANNQVIIGIGVNIAAAPKGTDVPYKTTCLKEHNIDCSREEFISLYLNHFDEMLAVYKSFGMSKIVEIWQYYGYGIGQKISVRLSQKEITGIFKGLASDGTLLLQDDKEKIINIGAGEILNMPEIKGIYNEQV